MKIAAGAMACDKLREREAIERKTIDIVRTHMKLNKKKTKKAPTSLRRFVIKYMTRLKKIAVTILLGKSQIIEATASAKG
jgi:hypothetical protein